MKRRNNPLLSLLIAASAAYMIAVLLTNLLGSCWFSKDMYADAYLAGLMARDGTLFPESWIFGNQYYVIATPALAGLLCNFIKDSALALRLASCVMTAAELFLFLWCVRPFFSGKGTAAGLCCICGAVLIGQSFSTDLRTFQLFYTMGSFYACYVIGWLLCTGVFLRLNGGKKVGVPVTAASCAVCFALGMQSLRQTLVLIIPLILVEAAFLLCGRKNRKRTAFVALSAVSNIGGLAVMKLADVGAYSLTEGIGLTIQPAALLGNLEDTLRSFAGLTGLSYLSQGLKWLPLGLAALFIWAVVLAALVWILRTRDSSAPALLCLIAWISLLGVAAVGTLLMRVRDIYFFVWFLLAAFSFAYLTEQLSDRKKLSAALAVLLLGMAAGNWFYNFYPDAVKYREYSTVSRTVAEELRSEGVDTIFPDFSSMPIFASASGGEIAACPVDMTGKTTALFCPVCCLVDLDRYENVVPEHCRIVFSEAPFFEPSAPEYMEQYTSEDYRRAFGEKTELEAVRECGDMTFYIYRFSDPGIIAGF